MFKKATVFALFASLAAPAAANDAFAIRIGVKPGVYTLGELVQIMQTGGKQREIRMDLIDRRKAAFRDRVLNAMSDPNAPVLVTRRAGN